MNNRLRSIKANQLHEHLSQPKSILLDVREEYEYEDGHLESIHIPMADVRSRVNELQDFERIIVCCKSGKRAQAVSYFLSKEFPATDLMYLEGGLEAYDLEHAAK